MLRFGQNKAKARFQRLQRDGPARLVSDGRPALFPLATCKRTVSSRPCRTPLSMLSRRMAMHDLLDQREPEACPRWARLSSRPPDRTARSCAAGALLGRDGRVPFFAHRDGRLALGPRPSENLDAFRPRRTLERGPRPVLEHR